MLIRTGSPKKHETWKKTWGLLINIVQKIKGLSVKTNTGLSTKDATLKTRAFCQSYFNKLQIAAIFSELYNCLISSLYYPAPPRFF